MKSTDTGSSQDLWYSSLPKREWELVDTTDLGEYPGAFCQFCGTGYRYEHEITHPEVDDVHFVGCVCAEKLTGDCVNPRKKERELRNKSRRKKLKWNETKTGNYMTGYKGHKFLVYKKPNGFIGLRIDKRWGKMDFMDFATAKAQAELWVKASVKPGIRPQTPNLTLRPAV